MEHLPRAAAVYEVTSLDYERAKLWLTQPNLISIVRTTEMISAIEAGIGIALSQSPHDVTLHAADEALLISLSFSVLLAWAEQSIPPLPDDWRCALLRVRSPGETLAPGILVSAEESLLSDEPV